MHDDRFDFFTRSLTFTDGATRRGIFSEIAAALALGSILPRVAEAKQSSRKNRKTRKKPLVFNAFGCIDVGQRCRGSGANCCSGICNGRKPKKGERDKSRCVAHDTGECTATDRKCASGPCTTTVGRAGGCTTTTGNAPYCADLISGFPCSRDADCQPYCGPLAACIVCVTAASPEGVLHCAGPGECNAP